MPLTADCALTIPSLNCELPHNFITVFLQFLHIFAFSPTLSQRYNYLNRRLRAVWTVSTNRKDDPKDGIRFHSDRIFKDSDKWYFQTREGTLEGPFDQRIDAENQLEYYIKVMNSGFMPAVGELEIEPLST